MIFPAICPACGSASGRRVLPMSPEVDTFRCGACRMEWSEPAAAIPPVVRWLPTVAMERLRHFIEHR